MLLVWIEVSSWDSPCLQCIQVVPNKTMEIIPEPKVSKTRMCYFVVSDYTPGIGIGGRCRRSQ